MSFLAPAFLWSLAALLPLAAAYFLKVRPRPRTTTAFFLWEKIFTEKKASSLLHKLRDLFSLLLMLFAFAMVAFALARPVVDDDERRGLLLLIDTSASMETVDGDRVRLEKAVESARKIIRGLNGNQRAAIVSVGESVEFLSNFTESPRELLDAVDQVEPWAGPLNPDVLSEFFTGYGEWSENVRTVFLTDGQFEDAEEIVSENVEILKIGAPTGNVGLVVADLARLPEGRLGLYFKVASSFEESVEADLLVSYEIGGGEVRKLIPLTIEPGENESEFFEIENGEAGRWTARIDLEDALASDNSAYLVVNEPQPVSVFVAAEGRYFFETSILSFEESLELVRDSDEADVAIGRGNDVPAAPLRILFSPTGDSELWSASGEEVAVEIPRATSPDHPALRYLDIEAIDFAGARQLSTPKNASVLVESESGIPLIFRVATPDSTVIIVNMKPLEAGFYFSAWFPTFLYSASTHLAGREKQIEATYRPGEPQPLPGFREGEATTVTTENEAPREVVASGDGGSLQHLGFYGVENVAGSWSIGSSLLSLADSAPREVGIQDTVGGLAMGRGIPYWLIAIAILLLTAESVLYHRRKVG